MAAAIFAGNKNTVATSPSPKSSRAFDRTSARGVARVPARGVARVPARGVARVPARGVARVLARGFACVLARGVARVPAHVLASASVLVLSLISALVVSLTAAIAADDAWTQIEESAEKAYIEGRLEEAERLWKSALEIAEKDAPNELNQAHTLNQMTHLLIKHKHFSDAERNLTRALEIRRKQLGKENVQTLETAGNLALIKHKLGHEKDAEKLYLDCIEVKRKAAPDSPSLAITLTNLANLYSDHRKCAEAKKLYLEALAIDEKAFGADHLESARDRFNLGALMYRCGDAEGALEHFEKAEGIYKALNVVPEQVRCHHYLGLCRSKLNDHEKASQHFKQAIGLHQSIKGADHPDSMVHVLSLARSLDEQGKTEEAEKLLLSARETLQKSQDSFKITESEIELAHFYKRQGKEKEAEEHFKKALETYETLNRHQQRKLYELPRAYADLLKELKREADSQSMANKYLHLYAPEKGEHMKF